MSDLKILEFEPVLKRIRWGGRRLGTVLNKPIGNETDYAESWEVSCHSNGPSVIANGPFAGRTLQKFVEQCPDELLGTTRRDDAFPLLIKFLDATDRLSVQVHPDDAQASQFEPGANGKTEAWVILDAEPDSRLYVGLKEGVDVDRLRAALEAGNVEDCLHTITVQPGDCVFIPAGTVHAIGEGILLAEVQQSSDITFRLYDWGRVGTDGQPRELHIEEAISCIDFNRGPVDPVAPRVDSTASPRMETLVESEYFTMRRHTSDTAFDLPPVQSFRVLMTLGGAGVVSVDGAESRLSQGKTVLIPACAERPRIDPDKGVIQLLEAVVTTSSPNS